MNNRIVRDACRSARAAVMTGGVAALLVGSLVQAADPVAADISTESVAASGRVHEVSQKNKRFAPGAITVQVGDEVTFLNDDEISHNVFSRSEDSKFNLKIQRPGEHKSHRFESAGRSVVRCAIHPNMKLVVDVVEPDAAPTDTGRRGKSFEGADAGQTADAPAEVAP